MNKNKITFVFQSGRTERLSGDSNKSSKEFFYSYHNFLNEYKDVRLIEFHKKKNFFHKLITPLFRTLRYLTTIPFYCENILSIKNFKILNNSENIIFTNQRVAFSSLPILLYLSLFKKKNLCVFIMGLFVEQSKNRIRKVLRKLFIKVLLKIFTNVIFLSKSEKELASSKFPKNNTKMHFLPFPVDTEFWDIKKTKKVEKDSILFIGNDGKRDYDFAVEIANQMSEYKFIFVSKQINQEVAKSNIEILNGKWDENLLTDSDIRDIYRKSLISIIPLKNSFQPSGQSVALQSMSMKIPVIITKTNGFWDKSKFSHNKNIIFTKTNSLKEWEEKIEQLF